MVKKIQDVKQNSLTQKGSYNFSSSYWYPLCSLSGNVIMNFKRKAVHSDQRAVGTVGSRNNPLHANSCW